jgi:hypothetical protein
MVNQYVLHRIGTRFKKKVKGSTYEPAIAWGIASLVTADNGHVVLLDYDIQDFHKVYWDVIGLIKKYKLSDCHVYKTKNGFHAVFYYNVMRWKKLLKIIMRSKVDWKFKSLASENRKVVLRFAGKYKINDIYQYTIIPSPYQVSEDEKLFGDSIKKLRDDLVAAHLEDVLPDEVKK